MKIKGLFIFIYVIIFSSCKKADCIEKHKEINQIVPIIIDKIVDWEVRNSGISGYLYAIDFPTAKTGYISGLEGVMYKTADSGQSYQNISPFSSNYDSFVLDFVDENTGYVAANNGFVDGQFYKTVNGGQDWQSMSIPPSFWRVVKFVNLDLGFAGGGHINDIPYQGGVLYRTIDGGQNWKEILISGLKTVRSIFFVNNTMGYMCCTGGQVYKTFDAGLNWIPLDQTLNTNIPDSQLISSTIFFKNKDEGFCITYTAFNNDVFLMKTSNGGNSWTRIILPSSGYATSNFYLDIVFADTNIGYIIGGNTANQSGSILRTVDGGLTWYEMPVYTRRLNKISLINPGLAYIVGENSTILKSVNY